MEAPTYIAQSCALLTNAVVIWRITTDAFLMRVSIFLFSFLLVVLLLCIALALLCPVEQGNENLLWPCRLPAAAIRLEHTTRRFSTRYSIELCCDYQNIPSYISM